MLRNLNIRSLQVLLLKPNQSIKINLDTSYSIMSSRFTQKLIIPSCIQTHSSVHYQKVNEFSTIFSNMDKAEIQESFTIHYEELLKAQKDDNVLIIDVREQEEIDETGKLPESIHIPMGNVVNMLNIDDDKFKYEYKKAKPNKNTKIILSCKSGRRSAAVQQDLRKLGYKNTYNYVGGWSEWENRTKK